MAEGGRGLTRGDAENRLKFLKNFKFFSSLKQKSAFKFQSADCYLIEQMPIDYYVLG